MMADVMLAVTLVIYTIFRMNEVGVNLASLITTSAVLTGAIAFSMQAMLGNLWGGIALQADNTCRIGDWIRVDGVVGQIIGIRWRCLAVATNDGETVMMPNAQLVNSRVTVAARRPQDSLAARHRVLRRLRIRTVAGHRRRRGIARPRGVSQRRQ
jgi:small-conductance mechanosensitive channel